MDQITSQSIEPELFKSKYVTETKARAVWIPSQGGVRGHFEDQTFDIATGERIFEDQNGNLLTVESINWKYVGHECWTGFPRD